MAKHGLEGVSIVWWMLTFTICRCICIKMALTDSFFTFLVVVGIRGEKGSFEHGKTWFGRRFCCLVIYANFHDLPLYMHQNGSDRFFFHFSCGCWD